MKRSYQAGFSALEVILGVVVIGFIGFTGYNVYNHAHKTAVATPAKTVTASPVLATKTFTTSYEKLIITYPNGLLLADTSQSSASSGRSDVLLPGTDNIKLTATNGAELNIATGLSEIGGACPNCRVLRSVPVTVLGQKEYFNYIDQDSVGKVNLIIVGATPVDTFGAAIVGKNIHSVPDNQPLPMSIVINLGGDTGGYYTLAQFDASADVAAMLATVAALHY